MSIIPYRIIYILYCISDCNNIIYIIYNLYVIYIVTEEKWKTWSIFLLYCTGLVEERMEMDWLMKEADSMEGWQEMEGKEKVVWVVDQACENGRVPKEVERLQRRRLD